MSTEQGAITPQAESGPTGSAELEGPKKRGALFWLVILGINVASFLALLEVTIVSNALPTIVNDLHGMDFVWAGASYNLAAASFMPSTGALAQVFGRKAVLIGSLTLFSLGSAICGAAQNIVMLISGRAIQGVGGAGILSCSAIIISDIVPLSERGVFNGVLQLTWCLACGIGPIVGGILAQNGQWRWVFYINLPIAPVAGGMVVAALHLKTPPKTLRQSLEQLDLIGNALIVSGACVFIIGLVWGGVTFPWNSPQVLAPLFIGTATLATFVVYEYKWSSWPLVPVKLMLNRTTFSGYLQVLIFPIPFLALVYYLPIYFQACKGASPARSGVLLFGLAFSTPPVAIMSGFVVTITRRYRTQLWSGWLIAIVGLALLGTTREDTSLAKVVGYEAVAGAGFGIIFSATYFPILAPLPLTSAAQALAFFAFVRQFSQILGISFGGVILQNQLLKHLPAEFLIQFPAGEQAINVIPLLSNLSPTELAEVRIAFADSLGILWNIMAGVCGLGLIVSLLMRHYDLNTRVDEDWGLQERNKD